MFITCEQTEYQPESISSQDLYTGMLALCEVLAALDHRA